MNDSVVCVRASETGCGEAGEEQAVGMPPRLGVLGVLHDTITLRALGLAYFVERLRVLTCWWWLWSLSVPG